MNTSHSHLRRGLIFLLMSAIFLLFVVQHDRSGEQELVAKGGRLFNSIPASMSASQARARDLSLADSEVTELLADASYGFITAETLGEVTPNVAGEACSNAECLQVTYYDYDRSGTVQAIVNLDTSETVATWRDPGARPGATVHVLPRAVAAAADDPRVTSVLGDIRQSELMMAPMSAWLEASSCEVNWCVDLTFLSPTEDGRVFHVVVDMEQAEVARTFYTRSRPDRAYTAPSAQGARFNDGCHEDHGWEVCWEMTEHDGINFYDATYAAEPVFSSVNIGQVEVYYPSWPGGYRDEIGANASVPAYYGTQVNDLDEGFEVRQLYTEFLRWPNCICCYRYEQIMRFFADGSFEPRFISHGPGCDDPSIYRPFWRIDLQLGETPGDQVWSWQGDHWTELETEQSLAMFEDRSPQGARLYTGDGRMAYVWSALETDPVGGDAGRLFVQRWRAGEGDGPIEPGEADTFHPPSRWIDGDPVSGENVVIWYVPLLETKKGGPWWCMPDPEPDFSPCESVLRVERASSDVIAATPFPSPTITATPSATDTPAVTQSFTPTVVPTTTPRPIAGEEPEEIILNSGCGSCHRIGQLGQTHKVGPDLSDIGLVAAERVPDMTAEEYLRQSILDPDAFIAPNCPSGTCMANVMPGDYGRRLTAAQLDTLVAFLLQQREKADESPLPDTRGPTDGVAGRQPSAESGAPTETATSDTSTASGVVLLIFIVSVGILLALSALAGRRKEAE
ncbi:MAG: hypothetical protein R3300_10930 [Candidatus Promineifilaceae bacterium]|nr:hypothetical protein [Candidatus Promineifilaceae bacterium]